MNLAATIRTPTRADNTATIAAHVRWIVRLELIREPKFGETRREVTIWAVRIYVALPDGTRRLGALVASYPRYALTAAHNRAHTEATTYYGDAHR